MQTIVDEVAITARTDDDGRIVEAWSDMPHTSEVLGLHAHHGGGFTLVIRYTREVDTEPTLRRICVMLVGNRDELLTVGRQPLQYVGSVSGFEGPLHVFIGRPRKD